MEKTKIKESSRKIGNLGLFGYYNYGNQLQNYAVQKILKNLGYAPILIRPYGYQGKRKEKKEFLVKNLMAPFLKGRKKHSVNRYINFYKFAHENLDMVYVEKEYLNTNDFNDEYYKFSIGSDQVWNPRDADETMFLSFTDRKKKICIAPSFGVAEIPENKCDFYKRSLSEFDFLNVRELEGKKIIEGLTGKICDVVVDPTMAVKRTEWEELIDDNKKKNKYILCYFLGDEKYDKEVNGYKNRLLCDVVDISDKLSKSYSSGPKEFLAYIHDAQLVLTDSFHAMVFSIIFNRPFVAFDRKRKNEEEMNSRMNSLLKTFKLEARKANKIDERNIINVDFDEANRILCAERNKLLKNLREQLED